MAQKDGAEIKTSFFEREKLQARAIKEIGVAFGKRVVLKGGGALRFVFGSPRESEDLDYDVEPALTKEKLAEKMVKVLKTLGVEFSAPKQTQTVQRWKIVLLPGIPFKLEFSRREEILPAEIRVTTVDFSPWNLKESGMVCHYPLDVLFRQKLSAMTSLHRLASRDVFDLYFITALAVRAGVTLVLPGEVTAKSVLDKVMEISEQQVREELFPLLPPEIRETFEYADMVVALDERLRGIEILAQRKDLSGPAGEPRL